MKSLRCQLPLLIISILCGVALAHGPIAQLSSYHDFADQKTIFGIPHFFDVLSNLGFVLVALWGWSQLAPNRRHVILSHCWPGYRLFLTGLFLTGLGSSYYHIDPDNTRLVWDRLPIALACAGLLAGVWGDTRHKNASGPAAWLALAAVASVAWWYFTEQAGAGDLRPYLLLQGLPIVLIPIWQWIHGTPRAERLAFGAALLLYVIAKLAEHHDHNVAAKLGMLTGHTLKHLLATGAALTIVSSIVRRVRTSLREGTA
jgi:hypothetical protein